MSLSANKNKALIAMLNPDLRTNEDIASACNLQPGTIYNYLKDGDFQQALDAANSRAIQQASAKLSSLAGKACNVLGDMLGGEASDTNKRLAAVAILESLYKYLDQKNLQERLEKLEQKLDELGK